MVTFMFKDSIIQLRQKIYKEQFNIQSPWKIPFDQYEKEKENLFFESNQVIMNENFLK